MNKTNWAVSAVVVLILVLLITPAYALMTPPAGSYELTAIEGEFQTFSGNSFDGEPAYLAFTGEGLSPFGVRLDDPSKEVVNGDPYSFTIGEMTSEDKWAYEWDTAAIGLKPGTYTIYILQDPVDLGQIDDHCYFVVHLTVVPAVKESPMNAQMFLIGFVLISLLAIAIKRR